jgi:large subunit ribosomal protein L23
MNPHQIITRPLITEKSSRLKESENKYTFEVHPEAAKPEIKKAVETLFKVKVLAVNTTTLPGKSKRFGQHEYKTASRKKAVVTLKAGERIEFFENA